MRVRKKPVEVEAIRIDAETHPSEIKKFLSPHEVYFDGFHRWTIPTLEGTMIATFGDWIIKGVQGEIYPCKPDIFDATYEIIG